MNEQSQMMNQSQVLNQQAQMMSQSQMMMNQNQNHNQPQMINQSQLMNNQQPTPMMSQNQSQLMNRSYGLWAQPQPTDSIKFQNFTASQSSMPIMPPGGGRSNWKGKKGIDKRKDLRRKDQLQKLKSNNIPGMKTVSSAAAAAAGVMSSGTGGGYKPPTLQELQSQNRLKARRFYPKKNNNNNRFAPYAPRNTTSFIIRAKKSGGIASLVSPCPVTPAVLPTPMFSPSREVLGDMAKEEWGVDGYGSMKGLIRLRSPGNEAEVHDEDDDEEGGSSESDVEEHVEVERRLDHDLSRFEMIYPNSGIDYNNVLENRVDDQDTHIAQLEEENLTLKERLFLMERELGDLRRRMQSLERQSQAPDYVNEEVVENGSENESESNGKGDFRARSGQKEEEEVVEYVAENEGGAKVEVMDNNEDGANVEVMVNNEGGAKVDIMDNNEDIVEYISGNEDKEVDAKEEKNEKAVDVCMEELAMAPEEAVMADEDGANNGEVKNACSEKSIGDNDSNSPAIV